MRWPSTPCPPTCAAVRVIRILSVDRIGNEFAPDPQGNTRVWACPRYTAPERAMVTLKECPFICTESRTVHGPAVHLGPAAQVSVHFLAPWMVPLPRVILALTVHGPYQRAAETGGMAVRTTRMLDWAERLPPRSATTRY